MPYRCKLTEEQVVAIREDRRIAREVAVAFGVSVQTVYEIRRGRSWKNAPGPIQHRIRISHDAVRAIRSDARRAEDIAQQHGVSVATVRRIWRGDSWARVS